MVSINWSTMKAKLQSNVIMTSSKNFMNNITRGFKTRHNVCNAVVIAMFVAKVTGKTPQLQVHNAND